MDIRECYKELNGDFEDVLARLRSEALIKRFLLKFLDDKSYELLCDSLSKGDVETAFRAAHTLKGVCQNLSFTRLYDSSSRLTEVLRGGTADNISDLTEEVKNDYQLTTAAISKLQ